MSTGNDVEQFAALLRRLKDRADRSYGSLARRLDMNTSTLHRYCAGEAVPQDYAPVERLAVFCGATPEERLALHRLWLLAVRARQRPRAGEGVARPTGAGEPAEPPSTKGALEPAGGERNPDRDSRTARNAGGSAGDVDGGADGTGGDEGGTSGARPGHDAEADGAGVPASGAPGPGSFEPTVPWDAARSTAARSTGRPWYRRRRTVVGAAAATVLLVTLGGLSALSADRSHGDSAKAPVPSPTAGSGTSHHPSATSAGPSPSRSPAPPSAGRRAAGPPGATGGPSANTKGETPVPTGVPLTWTADSQVWQDGCGHDYVIDKAPAQVPPPPVQQDAGVWAATQGAVHGRQTIVQISVQGKSSTAVVLTALRVRVVSRGAPVTGTAYAMDQGCGGGLTPRDFSVDLDVDRPVAHARPGNDSGKPLPAVRFPYRVSAGEPEVLLVTATTEAYDCAWYLELDWSSQGRTGTVRIDDHGRPFRTSGTKGLPRYWYGTNGQGVREWVPAGS
ncbi:DNA-binding protein [Streptomyces bungoensis]|uniref:DNA-binding protein n=1 Tax=Streptomyces bungoensis TaxID=285568 RepID=A0A101SN58_9ACTN|nr:helix-turn-helix transcriptional regulator [Streptomyces bungoensis]KUN77065.1 DNA-binding protein [Streptomyces bungoensis]